MISILIHNGMRTPLFCAAAKIIGPCDTLLDIGCGIRPQNMVKCKRHICIEPHGEYADILEANGYEVIRKTAIDALDSMEEVDTIMALDVLEHMTRGDGESFVKKAIEKSLKQVVIFTPLGFMPQEETGEVDAWGFQGQEWQRHRSGWLPEDLPGWKCVVDSRFHKRDGKVYGAFFAVYSA